MAPDRSEEDQGVALTGLNLAHPIVQKLIQRLHEASVHGLRHPNGQG